ncbi:hypothetical protein SCLARK_001554 [Spiroplasma clarkii]|nr:hypothetical protein SCLARK_001554 [Spiroplasma clarkii]
MNNIEDSTTPSGFLTLLTIKNIITNEIRQVRAQDVQKFVVNEKKVNSSDTRIINDLFNDGVSAKDRFHEDSGDFDHFHLNENETSYGVDEIEVEKAPSFETQPLNQPKTQEVFSNIVQERANKKPDYASDFKPLSIVDETISDMTPIGELSTYEFIPTRLKKNTATQTAPQPELITPKSKQVSMTDPTIVVQKPQNSNTIKTERILTGHMTGNSKVKYLDDNVFETAKTQPSIERPKTAPLQSKPEYKNTTQTDKMMLEGITNKFPENDLTKSKTFGPLNTRRLIEEYENQQEFIKNKGNLIDSEEELTGLVYQDANSLKNNLFKNSKIYKTFKKQSLGLILIFVFMLLVPMIGIFMKLATFWLTAKMFNLTILTIINFSLTEVTFSNIIYLVSDILLIIITPILILTFMIYLVCYLVSTNSRQLQKLAMFNQFVRAKDHVIEGIQDYNSQTSRYFVKIHNEMKEIKKEISDLKKVTTADSTEVPKTVKVAH